MSSAPCTERESPTGETRAIARVCFLIDGLARGGTESQLVELIRRMNRSRVQPVLCLLQGEDALSRSLEPPDCPVRRLEVPSLLRPSSVRKVLAFARWLREQRIDALQVHFLDSTYFGILAARLAGIPVIRTRRNVGYWLKPHHTILGRMATRCAAYTITNCEAVRQACIVQERARPDSVLVFPNGIDPQRFAAVPDLATQWGRRAPVVGAVANLRGVKGLATLVQAAALVCETNPRVRFVVAGDGEERPPLERMIAERGLEGRFRLIGGIDDIPDFLAGLDVAVLCSQSEGLSNALLEYMAAGRAIVATAVGGNVEAIQNEATGLLVPPEAPRPLADAIDRVLGDRELALRFAAAARAEVAERFAWPAVVRRVEDFYLRIAESSQQ